MNLVDRWLEQAQSHPRVRDMRLRGAWLVRRLSAGVANDWRWAVAVGALVALQAALIVGHEPWRDEWQAMQIAVQSPDWSALLENLRYEGHPPLWYLLLRGLAQVIGPAAALPLAALLCAIPAQLAVLLAAPFTRGERLLLASSQFLLFEYFTISRSLTLGTALVVIALALHRSRWGWIAIALLPMCDFQFGLLSIVLIALRLRERRWSVPGIAAWAASGLAAAWTVRPAATFATELPGGHPVLAAVAFLEKLGTVLLPLQWHWGPAWDQTLPLSLGVLASVPALLFLRSQTRGDRLAGALLFGFVAICAVLSTFVYELSSRHVMLLSLVLIALAWVRALHGARLSAGMNLWLVGAAVCGLLSAACSAVVPFDTSRRLAAEIERRGLADEHWMSLPAAHGQVVTALTGIQFERAEQHCMQTFVRWNYRSTFTSQQKLSRYLAVLAERRGSFLLLSSHRFKKVAASVARPMFNVRAGFNGQQYHVYEVGPGRPRFSGRLPLCVGRQRPLAGQPRELARL